MIRVNVSRTGIWWRHDKPNTWIPFTPSDDELARVGDDTGVIALCDSDEEYVREACKALGASLVDGCVILPQGFTATGPLSGDWGEIAKTLRTGVTQYRTWRLEGIV